MNFKKAQTATEYLIILAVVIVIALIVVGVLGGIPSIGGGAGTNAAAGFWKTSEIGIDSAVVEAEGSGSLILRNNKPNTVTITYVLFGNGANSTDVVLAAGSTATIGFNDATGSYINSSPGEYSAGSSYSEAVSIEYTDSATNANFTFTGDGTEYVGTVAN